MRSNEDPSEHRESLSFQAPRTKAKTSADVRGRSQWALGSQAFWSHSVIASLDGLPLPVSSACQDCIAHPLRLEGIAEGRMGRFSTAERLQEVGNLMDE